MPMLTYLSAALLCYLGDETGAETSLLLPIPAYTALNSPQPIHAADGHYNRNS